MVLRGDIRGISPQIVKKFLYLLCVPTFYCIFALHTDNMHECVHGEIVAVVDRLLVNVLFNNKLR